MPSKNIVIDKSFLRSAGREEVNEIAKNHKLLICDALTYECLKDTPKNRAVLFRKLPDFGTACEYIPTVGSLIDYEIKNRVACGAPSQHIKHRDYSIYKNLCDENYILPKEQIRVLKNKACDFDMDSQILQTLVKWKFENYLNRPEKNEKQKFEFKVLADQDYINGVIGKASEQVGSKIPSCITFTPDWVTYRFFQAFELFSYDIFHRYDCIETITKSSKAFEKLKHDLIDLNYFILATLEGGFATKEKKLKEWWPLLCLEGTIYE